MIKTGGLPTTSELAGAIQISYPSSHTTIYLDTLLYGLERFSDREQLLQTLLERFGSKTEEVPEFEDLLVEQPLFDRRMLGIIDFQVKKLDELATHLQLIPALHQVFSAVLQQQFDAAMPSVTINTSNHMLQIVQTAKASDQASSIIGVQGLLEAVLDDYSGVTLTKGTGRRFIDESGKTLTQAETNSCQQALAKTVTELPTAFVTQLGSYWWSPVGQGQTRREYLADAFAEGFRQELYARRNDGFLVVDDCRRVSTLFDSRLKQWGEGGQIQLSTLTLENENLQYSRLAGVFVIESIVPSLPELLIYSAEKGLRRFRDRPELDDYFSSSDGRVELLKYLALKDRDWVGPTQLLTLNYEAVDSSLFLNCIDSIMVVQNSNMLFAINRPKPEIDQVAVMIDDALDVRHLIDRRLARLEGHDRWSETPGVFAETWMKTPSTPLPPASVVSQENPVTVEPSSWSQLIKMLDDDAALMWQAHPGAELCARQLLNKQLAVIGEGHLDAQSIRVQLLDTTVVQPTTASVVSIFEGVDLVTLFLERFSGYKTVAVAADSQIKMTPQASSAADSVMRLTPELINRVLNRAGSEFSAALISQTTKFYTCRLRRGDSQIFPGLTSCDTRAELLRIELGLEEHVDKFDLQTNHAFEQTLNFPASGLRRVFGNDAVEVHSVWLTYEPNASAVQMSNVFMLCQPLLASSKFLYWSSLQGIQVVDTLVAFKQALTANLNSSRDRENWLELFPEPQKSAIRTALQRPEQGVLSIDTHQVEGHFIEHLQAVELHRREQGVADAVNFVTRCQFEAKLFCSVVNAAQIDDHTAIALDAVSGSIQYALFYTQIPDWLKNASSDDLQSYAAILERHSQISHPAHDFLFGIPKLAVYAREQIVKQLNVDFPDHSFEPDTLKVTLTRYVGTPSATGQTPSFLPAATEVTTESLTGFALNHFSTVQGATLSVSSVHDSLAATLLTPGYVRGLIRKLDVGSHYQQMLAEKLDSKGADYLNRKSLFFKQWPILMIELALQKKLEGQLTTRAYDYLCGLMEMPDTLARQPVHDQDIVLCPLRLVAKVGAQIDTVPGFHVIGPKDPSKGPVVLHSIFNRSFCFKEYVDRESLLQDIRSSSSLQSQLMQRLPPEVQARYGHHSFHLPPLWSVEFYVEFPMFSLGPVTLDNEPVKGNVLKYLFEDAVNLLQGIAKQQSVTTAQADWESFTYLMTLGVEQTLIFMPSELSLLITAWQGVLLLQSSADSVARRDWGRALAEFTVALSVFAVAKQAAVEDSMVERQQSHTLSKLNSFLEFSWKNSQLPAEIKLRLKAFEASDIALDELLKDDLYNLYKPPLSEKTYAAVAGKVYQVRQELDRWYIVNDDKIGPNIRLNAQQQWELNTLWGLKGGGGLLTRPKSRLNSTVLEVDAVVAQTFSVIATGIPEIKVLYRRRARQIGRAHSQATKYLETCLDNLNVLAPNQALNTEANQIISDFFGVSTASPELVLAVKRSVKGVFKSIMHASLAPYSSSRYVIGLNKPGHEATLAFTLRTDPLSRIFLSEGFFEVRLYQLKTPIPGRSFKRSAHYRAATIIHEVSHLSNDTLDIAYLESTAPFLDLMAVDTPDLVRLRDDVEEIQKRYLSHQTPSTQLFKRFKHGRWKDLGSDDSDGEGKAFVLATTGTSTLADARVEFLANADKRAKILLNNADSLTLLVTLLGRRHFPSQTV
ncbi:DUF6543 domain-containing protein [Pseudomonas sp.]|uniref:dermonecrotic toxin domain-containing protein n=1 Tax=Pseudomonas sp. TaxID=306 RepID=UPI00262CF8CD|nr:DUF6543 domain-containing protein [Pseudomonas sp.]